MQKTTVTGLTVTGSDTGIGKTVVCAALLRAFHCAYWKPIQSGLANGDDDTKQVYEWAELSAEQVIAPVYRLNAPLSPDQAAKREGLSISLDDFNLPNSSLPLVIEGAGGLLVPINKQQLMADLFAKFALPVLVVASSGLGTINHSLLTLEAMRARGLTVRGVVLSGPYHPENAAAIARHGQTQVIQLPQIESLSAWNISRLATTLREELEVLS